MTGPLNGGFMSPRISSPMHPGMGRGGRGGRGGGMGGMRKGRELIGATIKIIMGPYKGWLIPVSFCKSILE